MKSNLLERPLSEPRLITQSQLDFMRGRFKKEVVGRFIDANLGVNTDGADEVVDLFTRAFEREMSENYILTNYKEVLNG